MWWAHDTLRNYNMKETCIKEVYLREGRGARAWRRGRGRQLGTEPWGQKRGDREGQKVGDTEIGCSGEKRHRNRDRDTHRFKCCLHLAAAGNSIR